MADLHSFFAFDLLWKWIWAKQTRHFATEEFVSGIW